MNLYSEFFLPAISLWWRDIVSFYRQPSRVIGTLGPPLIFWLLVGSGMGESFKAGVNGHESNFMAYFYPGMIALTCLFTSIFTNIALIQDRTGGFLQGVLVSPVSRGAVVLGRVLGGATLACLQGFLLIFLSPLVGYAISFSSVILLFVIIFSLCFGLTALSLALAWKFDSIQGFHSVMNFVLAPMWFLSGSFFPVEGTPFWLNAVMRLNPMTYGVEAMRQGLLMEKSGFHFSTSTVTLDLGLLIAFGLVSYIGAIKVAARD